MSARTFTYDEWLAVNGVEPRLRECDECDGMGFKECYACGHENECDECGGRGEWDETRDEYEAQVRADLEKLKRYEASVTGGTR